MTTKNTLQATNLNRTPYFDDYDPSKRFLRVLYKPAKLQARELNHTHSILQHQIAKFGNHVFTDGSMVIPGDIQYINNQSCISVEFTSGITNGEIAAILDKLYVRSSNGIKAKVKKYITDSNGINFFVDNTTAGSDNTKLGYEKGDSLTFYYQNDEAVVVNAFTADVVAVNKTSSWVKINPGVYFVRGYFVDVDYQELVLSTKDPIDNASVGLRVSEGIVTEGHDQSLYSNAQGYPNFKGPGAHRFVMSLTLDVKPETDTNEDPNFIELLRITERVMNKKMVQSDYSLIERTLAQRTFEESGDYTVETFGIDIKEHLKQNIVDGVYSAEEGGDETKLVVQVKPGVGYVKGYRVENIGLCNISIDKSRDISHVNNAVVAVNPGSYFVVSGTAGLPAVGTGSVVFLRNASGTVIGSARVRSVQRTNDTQANVYVFDSSYNGTVASLYQSTPTGVFTATVNSVRLADNTNVYPLPYNTIKTLISGGSTDTTYRVVRSLDATLDGSGTAGWNLPANESFSPINSFDYIASYMGPGYGYLDTVELSLNATGRSLAIDAGPGNAGAVVRLVCPVYKTNPTEKNKVLTTATNTITLTSATSTVVLPKADCVSLISVMSGGNDVTSQFTISSGATSEFYSNGYLVSATPIEASVSTPKTFVVTYTYMSHSVGDYFSVDSYSGYPYELIPRITIDGTTYSLSDCLDFRPVKLNGVVANGDTLSPTDNIRADIDFYIGRIDSVYVDSDGNFATVRGVPSINPIVPDIPSNAMRLYDLYVPPYTFDATDVKIKYIENKRYTMRDIGKIDRRVENVEYYTSLNALELKTHNIQVLDPVTGNNRFKTGFATDSFTDFKLADLGSAAWAASIDPSAGKLLPPFIENGLDLAVSGSNGARVHTNTTTIDYTEVPLVSQLLATSTNNINPYSVFVWTGSITLTPSSDFWKDVVYNAPQIINQNVDTSNTVTAGLVWSRWAVVASRFGTTSATTVTESFESTTVDNFISAVTIPYMRKIDIRFDAVNLKPYARVYPFFDGVPVSTACRPISGTYNQPLLANAEGRLSGVFTVPTSTSFRFKTGTSTFRLTNSITDSRSVDELDTSAASVFVSNGVTETRQLRTVNTKTTTRTTTIATVAVSNRRADRGGGDPIAQTFFVPESGGAFITKVDIFFATKSSTVPVTLQIREVINGWPADDVLLYGEVVLSASNVVTSTNGTVPTSFVFSDPVYVDSTKQYCIVLISNTQEYNVYVAVMGENVIGQRMAVSKQPHIGVFMGSSNGSTWSEEQLKDMKFVVHRAKFGKQATVNLFNSGPVPVPLQPNAFTSTVGSSTVVVRHQSHGLVDGDTVHLIGVTSSNGVDIPAGDYEVMSATIDTFNITGTGNAIVSGVFGGDAALITGAVPFTHAMGTADIFTLPNTEASTQLQFKPMGSSTNVTIPVVNSDTAALPVEASSRIAGDTGIVVSLSSARDTLSPTVDNHTAGLVCVHRRINNDINNPKFVYVTQNIVYDNPSTSLRMYVGAKLPGGSSMRVYYMLAETTDWVEITPINPVINDDKAFREYEYRINNITTNGYKFKVVLLGDNPTNTPELIDFRTIALV